jgi:hypothetical protein
MLTGANLSVKDNVAEYFSLPSWLLTHPSTILYTNFVAFHCTPSCSDFVKKNRQSPRMR